MATFIVKTMDDRNLFIKAEGFRFHSADHTYIFFKEPEPAPGMGKIVASVPAHNVFAILDEEAFDADFYCAQFHDHEDSDPPIEEDEP